MPCTSSEEGEDWSFVKALMTRNQATKQKHKQKRPRSDSCSPKQNKRNTNTDMKTPPTSPKKESTNTDPSQPSTSLNFQANIPASNPFEPLNVEMDSTESRNHQEEKPPPIRVEQVNSFANIIKLLLSHIKKENFVTKTVPNRANKNTVDVIIKMTLMEDYR